MVIGCLAASLRKASMAGAGLFDLGMKTGRGDGKNKCKSNRRFFDCATLRSDGMKSGVPFRYVLEAQIFHPEEGTP
jgi:hypothetical protein